MIDNLQVAGNFARVAGLVSMYATEASLGKLRIRDPKKRLDFFTKNVSKYTRRVLNVANFDLEVFGYDAQLMKERNFLMVGNHMSYLDILVTSSVQPIVFVTSVDMGEQFFLGDMAELGGSIFVERRHRSKITEDIDVMAKTLRDGYNVMVYPEGKSTDGETVLPFKKSLLMSAVEAGVDILPVVTKYTMINGEPFGPGNRDNVCWYGEMGFVPHFMRVLQNSHVKAELHFLKPIAVTKESTRHELAEKTHQAISAVYHGAGAGGAVEAEARAIERQIEA